MKKNLLLTLLLIFCTRSFSQSYQLSFTGSGAASKVDSVRVENITQGTSISLNRNDILNLRLIMGINNLNIEAGNNLLVTPNPMTDNCYVEFEAITNGDINITVYDISGNKITELYEQLNKGQYKLKLSGLWNGLYLLKIQAANYNYSSKILSLGSIGNKPELILTDNLPANTETEKHIKNQNLKSGKSIVNMDYNDGDRLKLTAFSDFYKTVKMLVPDKSQAVDFEFIACNDDNNKNYAVVKIGKQIWMAENINAGTRINSVVSQTNNGVIEKYCYADDENFCTIYGGIYEWDEMMQYDSTTVTQGICPTGWHIPTAVEWYQLADTLGGWGLTGVKIMETGTAHWASLNAGTNESGFTALPGGYINYADRNSYDLGTYGYWWSTTGAVYCYLYIGGDAQLFYHHKKDGISVRCIKD